MIEIKDQTYYFCEEGINHNYFVESCWVSMKGVVSKSVFFGSVIEIPLNKRFSSSFNHCVFIKCMFYIENNLTFSRCRFNLCYFQHPLDDLVEKSGFIACEVKRSWCQNIILRETGLRDVY